MLNPARNKKSVLQHPFPHKHQKMEGSEKAQDSPHQHVCNRINMIKPLRSELQDNQNHNMTTPLSSKILVLPSQIATPASKYVRKILARMNSLGPIT